MFDNHETQSITKLLVFEFITGGGFSQAALPDSLATEGLLMLEVMIEELALVPAIQITVLLDWRFNQLNLPLNINAVVVAKDQSVYEILPALIEQADFIWPIAPEMDSILKKITALVEDQGKGLLNSSSEAVAICSDKLITAQVLQNNAIKAVNTIQLDGFSSDLIGQWVIKSKDGVGCLNNYLISSEYEFEQVNNKIQCKSDYIIQPYVKGDSLSLSCLFREGKAWLLCCNNQQVEIKRGSFKLNACEVNITSNNMEKYQCLIDLISQAIPGLWGYVGIDIIQPELNDPWVVEINPRLTTSYVGINQALDFNVAAAVLDMLDKEHVIKKMCNKQITVSITA